LRSALLVLASLTLGAVPVAGQKPLPRYVRVVDSFTVLGPDGRRDGHPFLGGLNVPRPQLADIDGDGDFDLFIQERSGEVSFFEQVGTPQASRFAWRSDHYQDLDIGEWFRLVDLDGDGDLDIMGEEKYSYIRVYRNNGSRTNPRFELLPDSVRESSGAALFSDRQNIPQITDLDCNGKLDLFLGRVTGTVDRYEAEGTDRFGLPTWKLLAVKFEGIEIIGSQQPTMHGANTMAFADYDSDGDQDLFWGDFFEQGLLLIENRGTCSAPNLRTEPARFPAGEPVLTSGYNAPAFADLDRDGDQDMVLGVIGGAFVPNRTAVENLFYLEQTGPRQFVVRDRQLLGMVDVGSESVPALADLDGDGDLDLLLANKIDPVDLETSAIYRFENTGTRRQPAFRMAGPLPFKGEFHYSPALGDLDGDGDLDMIVGTWRDRVQYYRNDGSRTAPQWTLADPALVRITRGSNTSPALGDLDGDGDLDLLIGESSGALNYYRNTGTRTEATFELVSDEWLGIDVGRRNAPALADVDGDGDLDLLLGSESDGLILYRNTGSRTEPGFVRDSSFVVPVQGYATPAAADLDGDGDVDLLLGGVGGGVLYFEAR
jgi:hypothetical protein